MAAKRTGTLVPKPSGFFARVWAKLEDGTPDRVWLNLETKDRATAERKLAKIVAKIDAGEVVADAQVAASALETVRSYALSWVERREAAGVVMANDERRNLETDIVPLVGDVTIVGFRPSHGRTVLAAAVARKLSHESVRKIRAVMFRVFKSACADELRESNPIAHVEVPDDAARDEREREILTDAEILQFLYCVEVPLWLKARSVVARMLGGMRTSQENRLQWSHFDDRPGFATCKVPMAKQKRGTTGKTREYIVPSAMRPILRAWWTECGCPAGGPVFPVLAGPRKGEFNQTRNVSYAGVLRRNLFKARVVRLPPITDENKKVRPHPEDSIYFDTPTSKRVDFHSFRRAYATGLAEAGVSAQQSMHLAQHSDLKTHMTYVMKTTGMQQVPASALPAIDELRMLQQSPAVTRANDGDAEPIAEVVDITEEALRARSDSNRRPAASKAAALSS